LGNDSSVCGRLFVDSVIPGNRIDVFTFVIVDVVVVVIVVVFIVVVIDFVVVFLVDSDDDVGGDGCGGSSGRGWWCLNVDFRPDAVEVTLAVVAVFLNPLGDVVSSSVTVPIQFVLDEDHEDEVGVEKRIHDVDGQFRSAFRRRRRDGS